LKTFILDPGHGNGTSRKRGASSRWCVEREAVLDVCHMVAEMLADAGVATHVAPDVPYHKRWHGLPADGVLSVHMDVQSAQWDPYALALTMPHEPEGDRLAMDVLHALGQLPETPRAILGSWETGKPNGTALAITERRKGYRLQRMAWEGEGQVCLSSYPSDMPRALVEVASVGHPKHRELVTTGRRRIAEAVAAGVLAFLGGS